MAASVTLLCDQLEPRLPDVVTYASVPNVTYAASGTLLPPIHVFDPLSKTSCCLRQIRDACLQSEAGLWTADASSSKEG